MHWKDGDITYEPVSNLSGASDALRLFLEENYPNDALLKVLSSLAQSDDEENAENGSDKANGVGSEKQLSWLARWHQKTTRGSTQYWLRKGDSREGTPDRLPQGDRTPTPEIPADNSGAAPEPEGMCIGFQPISLSFQLLLFGRLLGCEILMVQYRYMIQ